MKFKTFALILLTVLISLTTNTANSQTIKKDFSLAKVGKRIYGVYIFIGSEPFHEYDYIATVNVKITWTGSQQESLEKAIKKAKKKYPYFNGMIFHNSNFSKVDLIRFEDLDVSRGGVSLDSKVSFIYDNRVNYGTVVELQSSNGKATVKYYNIYQEEEIKRLSYNDLTPITDKVYQEKRDNSKKDNDKFKFNIGDKVMWDAKNEPNFGEIVGLDNKYHRASIKFTNIFGEEKIEKILYLDVKAISDIEYSNQLSELNQEVKKHTFVVGEKVKWLKFDMQFVGEIVQLNDFHHKASVKYLDENDKERKTNISYLDLSKL